MILYTLVMALTVDIDISKKNNLFFENEVKNYG